MEAKDFVGIIDAFNSLIANLDVLIIDTSPGVSDSVIRFSLAAQEILVVVCDEPTSLADSYALIKILHKDFGINRFRIVVNMAKNSLQAKSLFNKMVKVTDKYLDVVLTYLGSIPEDEYIKKAVKNQSAVVEIFPSAMSSVGFKQMAVNIAEIASNTHMKGHMQFFMEQFTNPQPLVI